MCVSDQEKVKRDQTNFCTFLGGYIKVAQILRYLSAPFVLLYCKTLWYHRSQGLASSPLHIEAVGNQGKATREKKAMQGTGHRV